MKQTVYQKPVIRDEHDNITQAGAYGKHTPFCTKNNDGILDYINNNLEALKELIDNIESNGGSGSGGASTEGLQTLKTELERQIKALENKIPTDVVKSEVINELKRELQRLQASIPTDTVKTETVRELQQSLQQLNEKYSSVKIPKKLSDLQNDGLASLTVTGDTNVKTATESSPAHTIANVEYVKKAVASVSSGGTPLDIETLKNEINEKLQKYLLKKGDTAIGNITAPKFIGNLEGVADSAKRLKTPVNLNFKGATKGSCAFDGSASEIDVELELNTKRFNLANCTKLFDKETVSPNGAWKEDIVLRQPFTNFDKLVVQIKNGDGNGEYAYCLVDVHFFYQSMLLCTKEKGKSFHFAHSGGSYNLLSSNSTTTVLKVNWTNVYTGDIWGWKA